MVKDDPLADGHAHGHNSSSHTHTSLTQKFATLALGDHKKDKDHDKKEHKRNFSLASRSSDKTQTLKANHIKPVDESVRILGTPPCPRMEDIPLLEPMVCKENSTRTFNRPSVQRGVPSYFLSGGLCVYVGTTG